ncbi:MAG: nucleotidyltransferase [Methanocellales archaeon]|nr:nucleotidyltransferase [Methanocellales archaeon]
MRRKPAEMGYRKTVVYDQERWNILKRMRHRTKSLMTSLDKANIESIVHGSVARGDISFSSDIDIFVPQITQSFRMEIALRKYVIFQRKIVQATPFHLPKAHILLDEKTMVTFPLASPKRRETEFYRFGGQLGLEEIDHRVAGADKRLMLIEPTSDGHIETPLSELSLEYVAKVIGVCKDTIEERIRVLRRRAITGRTGVYLDYVLCEDQSFEKALNEIASRDPAIRRRVFS